MKQLKSLLWKEWREARPYLWIGLGLFAGLPAVKCVQDAFHTNRHFDFAATPWVTPLGGVLAVFVAVGVTTRDLRPRLDDFWRSRPIHVARWVAAKYAVALAVVLAACVLPLVAELLLDRPADTRAAPVVAFLPFYLAAIFSVAFLGGCLIHRSAHAATMGLAAMLLVYTLPIVVPPLAWMSAGEAVDPHLLSTRRVVQWLHLWGPRQLAFAGGMLGLSAAAVGVAVVGVRRGWRVESGRKLLYALVAAVLLMMFASAAFQLATNLPVLQEIALPANEPVLNVRLDPDGRGGRVFTATPDNRFGPTGVVHHFWSRSITVRPDGITLGPPVSTLQDATFDPIADGTTYVRRGPVTYQLYYRSDVAGSDSERVSVYVQDSDRHASGMVTGLPVGSPAVFIYPWKDRLYVIGDRLAVVDVSAPGNPQVISITADPAAKIGRDQVVMRDGQIHLKLLQLPGVPAAQRLDATVRPLFGPHGFDGHVLCYWSDRVDHVLSGYRLAHLDDESAVFDKLGEYRPTTLQGLIGDYENGGLMVSNGIVYVGAWSAGGTFSAGLTLLDTRGPHPMRMVGRFAAPELGGGWPLPDGRLLVCGGTKLFLVAAPKRE